MKKKILFVLHLPPPIHGAAMVGNFIKESKYLNDSFESDYINLTTSYHLHQIGKAGIGKLTALLKIQVRLYQALLTKKYDLVYVSLNSHGPGFYKDFLIVLLLKSMRKRIVYHFHNKGVSTNQNKPLNHLLYRVTFRKTKSILLSRLLYTDVAKYVDKSHVFYCANGVPDIKLTQNAGANRKKPDQVCRILFLSNMYRAKGVFDLLHACKLLRQKNISFECHFVGDWSELSEETVRAEVFQSNLSDIIFLHGKKMGSEKTVYLEQADIFVAPSHNECFPLVLLEAMQFALPVVATTVGGIPDIVLDEKTGFLISPGDVAALAKKLETLLLNSDLRTEMGQAGKRHFKENFTLEVFEKNLKVVLEKAMMI